MKRKLILILSGLALLSGCAAPMVSSMTPAQMEAVQISGDLGMTMPELMTKLKDMNLNNVSFLRKNMDASSDIAVYKVSDTCQIEALMDDDFETVRALSVPLFLTGEPEDEEKDDAQTNLAHYVMLTPEAADVDQYIELEDAAEITENIQGWTLVKSAVWNGDIAHVMEMCISPDEKTIAWLCALPSSPSFTDAEDVIQAAESTGMAPDWQTYIDELSS